MNSYIVSLIRTGVPAAVGTVLAWLAVHGLDVPAADRTQITAVAIPVAIVAYYALARALERRWPKLGILLGKAASPSYPAPPSKG